MTPGPVSDSYDPEFGTGANASDVHEALQKVVQRIDRLLGKRLVNIVEVAQGGPGPKIDMPLHERDVRLIRFAINRELESI